MQDKKLMSRKEKDKIWEESKIYTTGYLSNIMNEWRNKLRRQEQKAQGSKLEEGLYEENLTWWIGNISI